MFDKELNHASQQVLQALAELGLPQPDQVSWNPTPFEGTWGFGSAASFKVAATEARRDKDLQVPERATEIARQVVEEIGGIEGFSQLEAESGYINLFLEPGAYALKVVDAVLKEEDGFGRGQPKADRVMVEFAQPNTHHSFHIGHARNAILGESLARIMEFAGFETTRASYPGDIGLGVIRCMWAYDKFYRGQEPEGVHKRGQWLADIYTEANQMLQEKPGEAGEQRELREQYESEIREMYQAWDAGDPQVRALWRETRAWSLDELEAILDILDVDMDVYFFESQVDEQAKMIAEDLIDLGIADDERPEGGPVVVKIDEKLGLNHERYRTAVILRSDGTTLYLTKDLALAKRKFEEFDVDRSVYVVDVRQSLHFQQVFKILELWGFPQAEKCFHLAYGTVTLPEGAMSARAGNVILFMDVVEESRRRVREIISEKNPDLTGEAADEVAQQVGLGALKYALLAVDNTRDFTFDWNRALDFEGQAAPYIQYAHVRASSILRRADALPDRTPTELDLDLPEIALLDRISRLSDEVKRAAGDYKPLIIANYAYELAKDFTAFYQKCPVLDADEPVRSFRLRLTAAARQALANSLRLLAVEAPEAM